MLFLPRQLDILIPSQSFPAVSAMYESSFRQTLQLLSLCLLTGSTLLPKLSSAEDIRFSRDVLPVLSENCFFCHGPDEGQRQAELRLDDESGAAKVLSREEPTKSSLLERILSNDPDVMMPPPDSNRQLTAEQKQTLKRWIESGAEWGRHWAFEPLKTPTIPGVEPAKYQAVNPIDNFAQQLLMKRGLLPSPKANRHTLIRRLSLDLTGLPPKPEEVTAFVNDTRPDAWERLVDRLLASPRFGERMAWDWLDAARYADSNGYQGDRERTMWPWRDWVIDAFNQNLPFDQFSTWQLAGDLLPNPTFEQKLATGFCRNHMINGEGGRIPEENRVDYVMDMTETMGTVWLGLTLNCCRCHDHKYDPLTQNEYYQFFAYFNNTPVSGGGGDPQTAPNMSAPSAAQRVKLEELAQQQKTFQMLLSAREKTLLSEQTKWEAAKLKENVKGNWTILAVRKAAAEHQTLTVQENGAVLVGGPNANNDTYTVRYQLPAVKTASLKLETIPHPTMTLGGLARSDSGNYVLTEIEFTLIHGEKRQRLSIAGSQATYEQGSYRIQTTYDGNSDTGWAVYAGKPLDQGHTAIFRIKDAPLAADGAILEVVYRHDSKHVFHNMGHFRLSVSGKPDAKLNDAPPLIADLRVPAAKRSPEQQDRIRAAFLMADGEYAQFKKSVQDLDKQQNDIRQGAPKVMIMADLGKPRTTNVLNRGLYNSPTDVQVFAATPASLPRSTSARPAQNRLDLARWLFSPDHPLTARVTVNRFWQQIFGIGIVRTIEDFGVQAEYPEHRDLLDWLAADFRDNGWDVKRLVKTIVMSHVYRQTSANREIQTAGGKTTLIELDPENRLLARGARYRLPSWMLRDQVLSASGLMNDAIGGSPVNTYQPAGVWEEATFGKKRYTQDKGDRLYRRSLYIFWRRIIGPTMFFDNASRQTCTVKSVRTNTPLHSLLTFNETTYVESSRYLAQKTLLNKALNTDTDRVQQLCLTILARRASVEEVAILAGGLKRSLAEFRADADAASRLLSVGESSREESIDPAIHAAWTSLTLALFNMDETLNRE